MHPVAIHDLLTFERSAHGVELRCDKPELPTDSRNLVHRAATAFLQEARIQDGVRIRLQKNIPLEAGLGGGSGNAATTLLGLNQLFGAPLEDATLRRMAAALGSDVPFFLQDAPAIAVGRGEKVASLPPFAALRDCAFFLIHPGFGVSTAWAYQNLARFPESLNGRRGRAQELVRALGTSLNEAHGDFYNSLEAPVLEKFPILKIFQEFLLENGAAVALMSGSGSTTFGVVEGAKTVERIEENFRQQFGTSAWIASVATQAR